MVTCFIGLHLFNDDTRPSGHFVLVWMCSWRPVPFLAADDVPWSVELFVRAGAADADPPGHRGTRPGQQTRIQTHHALQRPRR